MEKERITRKRGRNLNINPILEIGYGDLQNLLKFTEPQYYSAGIYGWDCDWYVLDRATICTGYRPVKGIVPDRVFLEKYDSLARDSNNPLRVKTLLKNFVNEVLDDLD